MKNFSSLALLTGTRNPKDYSFDLKDLQEQNAAHFLQHTLKDKPHPVARRILKAVEHKLHGGPNFSATTKLSEEEATIIIHDLMEWASKPYQLQKAQDSAMHRMITAFENKKAVSLLAMEKLENHDLKIMGLHSFVFDHDWGSAFKSAKDYMSGEWHLPYEACCFEFLISGKRVCAVFSTVRGDPGHFVPLIESHGHWIIPQYVYREQNGEFKPTQPGACEDHFHVMKDFILSQVRAVCIALEAEVAETEVVRAPHKLNREREKHGKLPIADHHIIHLTRRSRLASLPADHVPDERNTPRMHFVRGHWRHFSSHKTWIKWFLRGNPDLGFIDKEYRL